MRWEDIETGAGGEAAKTGSRLRAELERISGESDSDRLARLGMMYGIGPTDAEEETARIEGDRAAEALKLAQADKARADALKVAATITEEELNRAYPFPESGNRSLTEAERHAIWIRCSRVAGYALPRWPRV